MKKILTELSPSDIFLWGQKFAYPMVKNRLMQTKGSLKNAKRSIGRILKSSNKSRQTKAEIIRAIKNDPTLYGDIFRGAETARQFGSAYILQNLPPLPTADSKSIWQSLRGIDALAGNPDARKDMAKNVKGFLTKNPVKQAKDYFVNRATTGTYVGSPMTNYSSDLFGISGPIVDNNPLMMAFKKAGVDDQRIIDYIIQSKDYALGGLRNAGQKIRQYSFLGR